MAQRIIHLPNGVSLHGNTYQIVRFINSGGFGCTYEAEHIMLEKRVAIKEFFVKDFCNREEDTSHVTVGTQSKKGLVEKLRKKFIDEARGLAKLHHPGIVKVSDVFEENGTAYYVMDYIDGPSLNDVIHRQGALSEERALKYIRQVAEALKYVHGDNRLHLDVKPSNIMIDGDDNAILIDFGASKQYDECDGENTSTLMGKTPGFAPLEQMTNSLVRFTPSTDIYALGATLYKLLTGETPLDASLRGVGEELKPLPDSISRDTKNAVYAAMEIRRIDRPQSIDDFISMLKEPVIIPPKPLVVPPLPPEPPVKPLSPTPPTPPVPPVVPPIPQTPPTPPKVDVVVEPESDSESTELPISPKQPVNVVKQPVSTVNDNDATEVGVMTPNATPSPIAVLEPEPEPEPKPRLIEPEPEQEPELEPAGESSTVYDGEIEINNIINEPKKPKTGLFVLLGVLLGLIVVAVVYFVAFNDGKAGSDNPDENDTTAVDDYIDVASYIYTNSKGVQFLYTGKAKVSGTKTIPDTDYGEGNGRYENGTYQGSYKNGLREGYGVFETEDGKNHYEGMFANDEYSDGKLTAGNSYYEGTFMNGLPYEGEWKDEKGLICRVVKGEQVF